MKKLAGILVALLLVGSSALVLSCIVEETDDDIAAPNVYANNKTGTYTISFAPIPNMQYANIFREKSTDDFATVEETVNIGQVIPRVALSNLSSFSFEDPYANDTSATYRYFIRFWNGTKYHYSKPSKAASALTNSKSKATLAVEGDLAFLYVRNDYEPERSYTLFLQSDITLPADFEELHVIISIDGQSSKKPFLFAARPTVSTADTENNESSDAEYDAPYTFPGSNDIAECTAANLHTILPAAFRDRALTLEGIIGVHKIGYKDDDSQITSKNYTNYYWTKPVKIPDGKIQYAVRDDSDAGEWSPGEPTKDSNGKIIAYASKPATTFIVPTIRDPQNDLDYSDVHRAVALHTLTAKSAAQLDFTPYNP